MILSRLKTIWAQSLKPIFMRPPRLQVAALCYRQTKAGKEVLLITSRDTGRWLLPKGWPMPGKSCLESAAQEAWEEAGVRGTPGPDTPIGRYHYGKRRDNGTVEPLETLVYALEVTHLSDVFPEAHERKRAWMRPADAASRVAEPELRGLLQAF